MKIGIIALPKHPKIENYIEWIESIGCTAVIIPYSITKTALHKQMGKIHGVIWTGGAIETERYSEHQRMTYLMTLQRCFLQAKEYNDHGRYFPIWGSCLGFEMIVLMGEEVPLAHFFDNIQSHGRSGHDTITFLPSHSRLKQFFSLKLRNAMARTPCATHHHTLGFDINPVPHMRIVSVDSGFINMIEYVKYPFYGVQFHPERPFSPFSGEISRQFGLFLLKECKKN
jgi:gamma-glutamyl hydrolase